MKTFLLTVALLFSTGIAQAQSLTFTRVSSVTWRAIDVSTYTPTRVDNFNGAGEGLMSGRTALKLASYTGNTTLNCGYSASLSTQSASNFYGEELKATGATEIALSVDLTYYCMSQAASGAQRLLVIQGRPNRTLPGE